MPFDPEKLLNRKFKTIRRTYTEKDCMLYALGVGMGIDPLDEECLRFVYEDDLKVLPSQSVMMAHPGFWAKEKDTGLDWVKVLHAGQEIIMHQPLPTSGTVEATTRVSEIADKGKRIGALIVTDLMGFGVNTVTGDYSRGASGFVVERGEIAQAVEEITIAGNLRDMLMGIVEIGSDIDLRGNIRSGSILIDHMAVAGS